MESSWAKLGPQKDEATPNSPPAAAAPSAPKPITPAQPARSTAPKPIQPQEALSPTLPTGHGHFREPVQAGQQHSRNSSSNGGGLDQQPSKRALEEGSGALSPPKLDGRPGTAPAAELACALCLIWAELVHSGGKEVALRGRVEGMHAFVD